MAVIPSPAVMQRNLSDAVDVARWLSPLEFRAPPIRYTLMTGSWPKGLCHVADPESELEGLIMRAQNPGSTLFYRHPATNLWTPWSAT